MGVLTRIIGVPIFASGIGLCYITVLLFQTLLGIGTWASKAMELAELALGMQIIAVLLGSGILLFLFGCSVFLLLLGLGLMLKGGSWSCSMKR